MSALFSFMLALFTCSESFAAFQQFPENAGSSTKYPSEISRLLANEEELPLFRRELTMAFYDNRANQPAWKNTELGEALKDTLKMAEAQGLYFQDYHGQQLERLLKSHHNLSDKEISRLDILLTDAFFKFGEHLYRGKTDPSLLHDVWDIPREDINLTDLLEKAVRKNDLETALAKLRPVHKTYRELIAASKEYLRLKTDSGDFEELRNSDLIKTGMTDERVPVIILRLKQLGYLEKDYSSGKEYTPQLKAAVERLQQDHNLKLDGIVGRETFAVLNKSYEDRHQQILVNLERWRWYPRNLGERYALLNIPAYKLYVLDRGDTVKVHKTVVGTPSRPTPVFSRKIEHLIFNPAWFIPPTIKEEDVIPKARRNPAYLEENNISVYNRNWEPLNPYEINWSDSTVKYYHFRQNPGESNPMGRVKVMYPNKYSIYSHDTPAQHLFDHNKRTFSSGCVRVEQAIDFAEYLLREKLSSEEIDQILSNGERKKVEMEKDVQVHHFYWTAWRENGTNRFVKDIYDLDDKIYEALKNAS